MDENLYIDYIRIEIYTCIYIFVRKTVYETLKSSNAANAAVDSFDAHPDIFYEILEKFTV